MIEKLEKLHECKVTTLKNQGWWQKLSEKNKKRGTYIFCQYLSDLQVADENAKYYHEVANEGCRGAVATDNIQPNIFDIAVNPINASFEDRVKEGFLAILKEKIQNDLVVYEKMLDDMKSKGFISGDSAKIKMYDIASKLIEVSGVSTDGFMGMTQEQRMKAIQDKMYIADEKKQKIRSEVKKIVETYCT